jgi:hypothetical protein
MPTTIPDLNVHHDYRVTLNPQTATIKFFLNGQEKWSCTDPQGWNAHNVNYYSISRWSGVDFEFCGLTSKPLEECFVPDSSSYKFNEDWKLPGGAGEIEFKGKGRDVYIQLNNNLHDTTRQYWIVIGGWDNQYSKVMRGTDESVVCDQMPTTIPDLNAYYNYRVTFNPYTATIKFFLNGEEKWSCTDPQGWNADNVQYYSISKWSGVNFEFCGLTTKPLPDQCWTPDPANYKFENAWKLNNGAGEVSFKGRGRDVYVMLNDSMESSSWRYRVVIGGWDNSNSEVKRQDDSLVCFMPQTIADLNALNDYRLVFNPSFASIKLYMNGVEAWECVDPQGWNAPNAQYYSISRYSDASFEICNQRTSGLTEPTAQTLTGKLIDSTTGKAISPLRSPVVTAVNNQDRKVYVGIVHPDASFQINVRAGEYHLKASADEFIDAVQNISVTGNHNENIILTPLVVDKTGRVVLHWNLITPRALDLDIMVVNRRTKERVYYLAKTSASGQLVLDVDSLMTGPETVTIRTDASDQFDIQVRRYNRVATFIQSGAVVDVYRGNNLIQSIAVPAPTGSELLNTWKVGTYNAADGSFIATNTLSA